MISLTRERKNSVLGYSQFDEFVSISENFNPESEKYYQKSVIYIGDLCRVVKCRQKSLTGHPNPDDKLCAIKTVRKFRNGREAEESLHETQILKKLVGEPFLLQIVDEFATNLFQYTITDYIPHGPIYDLIKRLYPDGIGEVDAKFYLSELFVALDILHEKGIVHGDVKPHNILLDETGHVVLCDFDSSSCKELEVRSSPRFNCCGGSDEGSCWYHSEEVLKTGVTDEASDWYSFGVTAYFIAKNDIPFLIEDQEKELSSPVVGSRYISHCYEQHYKTTPCKKRTLSTAYGLKPASNSDFDSFIAYLLAVNPEHRLGRRGSLSVRNHRYFQDVDWDKVKNREVCPPSISLLREECEEENEEDTSDQDEEIVAMLRKLSQGFCVAKIT